MKLKVVVQLQSVWIYSVTRPFFPSDVQCYLFVCVAVLESYKELVDAELLLTEDMWGSLIDWAFEVERGAVCRSPAAFVSATFTEQGGSQEGTKVGLARWTWHHTSPV